MHSSRANKLNQEEPRSSKIHNYLKFMDLLTINNHSQSPNGLNHQNVADSSSFSRFSIKLPKKFYPAKQKSIKAFKSKNYEEVIKYSTEFLDKYPDSYSIRCDRSEAYMNLREYEYAKQDLDIAIRYKPKKERGFYLRGMVHDKLNHPNDSIKDLSRAIKIKFNDQLTLEAFKICAKHYKDFGKFNDAIECLGSALRLESHDVWALKTRGTMYFEKGKYSLALKDLTALLKVEGTNIEALELRGIVYVKLDRYDSALNDFNTALRLKPNLLLSLAYRSKIFRIEKRYVDALGDIEKYLKFGGELNVSVLKNRGLVYRGLARSKEALADFTAALQKERKGSIFRHRAHVYKTLRQYQEALYDLDQAIEIKMTDKEAIAMRLTMSLLVTPDDVNALADRGTVYYAMGELNEAMADLNKALSINSNHVSALLTRAKVYRSQKEYKLALKDLDIAIQTDSSKPRLYRNRGKILLKRATLCERLKKYHECLDDWTTILKHKPNDIQILQNRGKILMKLCRYEEAKSDFDQILKIDAQNIEIIALRAEILQEQNKYDEAINELTDAINKFGDKGHLLAIRGGIHMMKKEFDESLQDLNGALNIEYNSSSDDSQSLKDLGFISNSLNFLDNEEKMEVKEEIVTSPKCYVKSHVLALSYRGSVYRNKKDYDKALIDLNTVLNNEPNNAFALYERSSIYRDNKQFDEAWMDIERALKDNVLDNAWIDIEKVLKVDIEVDTEISRLMINLEYDLS
ncbi:16683_t:CDS:2 [Dentiscutata heterogama]|uniref:16683_t:CDS:1 n=1 Tax=Dentiscutata heterogama TaxID=1316150 RepID=A0ACA9LQ71_9GLOM|nr:16683_t:CDS:2 [Dentiscutata heterogama]